MSQFIRRLLTVRGPHHRHQRRLSRRRLGFCMAVLMTVGMLGALPATASVAEQAPPAPSTNEEPAPESTDDDDGESTGAEQTDGDPEDDATDEPTDDKPSDEPQDDSSEKPKKSRLAAAALAAQGCGYADTSDDNGDFVGSICWFDFADFDVAQARTSGGQPMEITLEGGFTARFALKITDVAGTVSMPIAARPTPLETRFAFGTNAYRGVPGQPALYSQGGVAGVKGAKVSLEDIEVVDSNGNPISEFSFVAADTEDNVSGESFTWTSDQPLSEIERLAPNGNWGCKNPSGLGTTEVHCDGTGAGGSTTAGGKSTALLVAAESPTTFATEWRTFAQSGIAIGIRTATVAVTKQIESRVDSADAFDVSIASPEGTTLASASTGSDNTATTGPVVVIPRENGDPYTISEAMASGSPTPLTGYAAAWNCVNDNTSSSTTLPSGNGFSKTVAPEVGDGIQCIITNNAPPDYDFGDAPNSYATTLADNGPRHGLVDGVRLGAAIDDEADGQPSDAADGDGADEDGVSFNAELDFPDPTIRTGTDATTGDTVQNELTVNASAAGFASAWVDWNLDGDFGDDGERVADAEAVDAGDNDLTFSRAENPDDIRTFTRVRFSTDASTIHDPTGEAADGEVEDYQVLIERLLEPASCGPVGEIYHAMTFNSAVDRTGNGAPGSSTRYPDVTVVDGQPVDMVMSVVSGRTQSSPPNGMTQGGDDAFWNIPGAGNHTLLRYSFYRAGTDTPIAVNGIWTVNDHDNGEQAHWLPGSQLADWAITEGSEVQVIQDDATEVTFAGRVSGTGSPSSRFQVWFAGQTSLEAQWRGFQNSGFVIDGDGDTPLAPSCEDYGDAPVSYGTVRADDGPRHVVTPDLTLGTQSKREGDAFATSGATGDDINGTDDEDAIAQPIVLDPGNPTTVQVAVTNDTAEVATLAGWMDVDDDGQFETSERVVVTVPANSGTANHELNFPAGSPTSATFARFRLFPGTVADPSPLGAAPGGEVEDHMVTLRPILDFGDAPNSYGTTLASNGPRHPFSSEVYLGSPADEDSDGQPGPGANGDDTSGSDDEDGVTDPIVQTAGEPTTVSISATNTLTNPTTGAYFIVGWIDLDNDGTFETGERQFVPLPANSGTATYTLTFPAATVSGTTYARFRTTRSSVFTTPTGPSQPGEVEDHRVSFNPPVVSASKSVSPESGTAVGPGQDLTYTLTFDNSDGTLPANVDWTDHLAGVLDDAELTGGPDAGDGLTVTPVTGGSFDVGGLVPAGEVRTVTYTVTVGEQDDRLDSVLNNFLEPTGDDPPEVCETDDPTCTTNPVVEIVDSKSVSPDSGSEVAPGQELTYTLRFENVGAGAGEVDRVDDLSHVLDDATVTSAPVSSNEDALQVSEIADGRYSITGDLEPADGVVTVTYTVTVNDANERDDHVLANYLLDPDEETPAEPVCSDDEDCTLNSVRELVDSKSVSPDSGGAVAGQELTFTLTFENLGGVAGEVDRVDDLTHVLDDATVTSEPVSSDAALEVSAIADDRYSITGELEPGSGPVTVTYTVTVNPNGERGDDLVGNFLLDPDDEPPVLPICLPDAEDCTVTGVAEIVDSKSVTPDSGSVVVPGQELTYTLTFENVGAGPGEVNRVDDLTHVLDDATVTNAPVASEGALDVSSISDGRFTVTGTLEAEQTVTVTYTVRVDEFVDLGDQLLANFLIAPDAETPEPEACEDDDPDCAVNEVSNVTVVKTSDPESGTTVEEDDEITYTLTFSNNGRGEGDVDFTDHMANVLDDATIEEAPEPSDAALAVSSIEEDAFTVTGSLTSGQQVTVTYVVEVLDFDEQGNHALGNFVTLTGQDPPATCAGEQVLCTLHAIQMPDDDDDSDDSDESDESDGSEGSDDDSDDPGTSWLPDTGAGQGLLAASLGLLLIVTGAAIVRRNRAEPVGRRKVV